MTAREMAVLQGELAEWEEDTVMPENYLTKEALLARIAELEEVIARAQAAEQATEQKPTCGCGVAHTYTGIEWTPCQRDSGCQATGHRIAYCPAHDPANVVRLVEAAKWALPALDRYPDTRFALRAALEAMGKKP